MAYPVPGSTKLRLAIAGGLLATGALALSPATTSAQGRDPAYAAARAGGQIGEMMNGYLGVIGGGSADLRHMAEDINIRRKAVYAEKAQAQHATVEEYAFTSGCVLILHTQAGEKYQAPDGSWKTRTGDAPSRDPRCP